MPSSLKDVAGLAGVSIKTVSNVVHGYAFVSDATRAKVSAALHALDYRPNLSARGLRTGRSNLIALAIPTLDEPYFGEIASLIVNAAESRGLTVLIDQTGGDRGRERQAAEGVRGNLIDGVIASPLAMTSDDVSDLARRRPMVLLGERFNRAAADHVAVDSVGAAHDAVCHLIELGRSRIGFIGAETDIGTAALRLAGYRKALAEAGQRFRSRLVVRTSPFRRSEGAAAVQRLMSGSPIPDAVFCVNDLLALGAIRALVARGIRVPEDVAVVGFDDIEDGRFSWPTLTSVRPDKSGIAERAVELLQQRILRSTDEPARDVVAGHTLAVRQSTDAAAEGPFAADQAGAGPAMVRAP